MTRLHVPLLARHPRPTCHSRRSPPCAPQAKHEILIERSVDKKKKAKKVAAEAAKVRTSESDRARQGEHESLLRLRSHPAFACAHTRTDLVSASGGGASHVMNLRMLFLKLPGTHTVVGLFRG